MKNCPECGTKSPMHDTRDLSYTYKGETTTISSVTGHYCANCGEITLDRNAVDRYMQLVADFQRKVNDQMVDPAVILAIRN